MPVASFTLLAMKYLDGVTAPVLFDGLYGGVLGTIGAFGAALLALGYARAQQHRQDAARTAEEREARRRRAAASLTGILRTLEAEARWTPFLSGRTVLALSSAVIAFEAEVGDDHPEVSRWLTDRYDELVPALQAWRRALWWPPAKKHYLGLAAHSLGELTAMMATWSTGRATDAEVVAMRFEKKLPGARRS